MNTLKKILISIPFLSIIAWAGIAQANTLYNAPALFETSLASQIGPTATSAVLVNGTLRDGTSLFGNTCLTVDSGLTNTEFMCGIASGTTISNLIRGIGEDASTTYPGLEYNHRYGADVKVTDFPYLQQILNALQGLASLPNIISYANTSTPFVFTQPYQIVSKAYVDSVATSGAPDAGIGTKGIIALGNLSSAPTSTDGSSVLYTLPSKQYYASSSQGTMSVVMTNTSGVIDSSFVGSTTAYSVGSLTSGSSTLNGATYANGTTTISANLNLPGATSSVLTVNSGGVVTPIRSPANGTGTVLAFNGSTWGAGLYTTYSTSSVVEATTTVQNVSTTTVPTGNANSIYNIYTTVVGTIGNGATTTITFGGNTLCVFNQSINNAVYVNIALAMQNSTSSGLYSGTCVQANNSTHNALFGGAITTNTPVVNITSQNAVATSNTLTSTSSVTMEQ